MRKMTLDQLVEQLKKACADNLLSVLLYGSAVGGDHLAGKSDYNILLVLRSLGLPELQALSPVAAAWHGSGHPAPLLFTPDYLRRSADVFPIELLDIQDSRKVLYGEDVVAELAVARDHLRLQVEHELKGQFIQLQRQFLLTGSKASAMISLMTGSLSSFLVLFRAALRLYHQEVPRAKVDALKALATQVDLDVSVFETIRGLKAGTMNRRSVEAASLFNRYMENIELVIKAVDALGQPAVRP